MRASTRVFLACAVVLALLCGQAAAIAQENGGFTLEDQREVASYLLSMDKIRKLLAATKELKEWEAKNPDAAKGADQPDEGVSLADKAKKFESKYPEAAAIVKKSGLGTREFFVATYVFFVAASFVGMKKAGQIQDYSSAQDTINPANLELVESHWDEIEKLTTEEKGK